MKLIAILFARLITGCLLTLALAIVVEIGDAGSIIAIRRPTSSIGHPATSIPPPASSIALTASLPLNWTFESSTDLVNWSAISNVPVPSATINVPVPSATINVPANQPAQFFRVVTADKSGTTLMISTVTNLP